MQLEKRRTAISWNSMTCGKALIANVPGEPAAMMTSRLLVDWGRDIVPAYEQQWRHLLPAERPGHGAAQAQDCDGDREY